MGAPMIATSGARARQLGSILDEWSLAEAQPDARVRGNLAAARTLVREIPAIEIGRSRLGACVLVNARSLGRESPPVPCQVQQGAGDILALPASGSATNRKRDLDQYGHRDHEDRHGRAQCALCAQHDQQRCHAARRGQRAGPHAPNLRGTQCAACGRSPRSKGQGPRSVRPRAKQHRPGHDNLAVRAGIDGRQHERHGGPRSAGEDEQERVGQSCRRGSGIEIKPHSA